VATLPNHPEVKSASLNGSAGVTDSPSSDPVDLSVVVPFFNPGAVVRTTVDGLINALSPLPLTFEIIAVSDGSTDHSESTLIGAPSELARCVRLEQNRGKGACVRLGFELSRGALVAFIDADGDLPPDQMADFVSLARSKWPDILVGSKRHSDSLIHASLLRRAYSVLWQYIVCAPFRLGVRDTQTGLKAIRREVMDRVLPLTVEDGFAFDLELLVVARRLGYRNFVEAPVRIIERRQSTISARIGLSMAREAVSIYGRCYLGHLYDDRPRRWFHCRAPSPTPYREIDLISTERRAPSPSAHLADEGA
jgi:glycosyltransferase involved in cell wall biosynthesis